MPRGVTVESRHSTEVVIYDDDRKYTYSYVCITIFLLRMLLHNYMLKDTRLINILYSVVIIHKIIMRDSMEHTPGADLGFLRGAN